MVDLMVKSDLTVYRPEDIYLEKDTVEVKDMVNNIRAIAHSKANLVLILCVPPENLEDYGEYKMNLVEEAVH